MKTYHKNPRQITDKQMDQLRRNLAELGDLSGIVHDLNSDEIIGGNQRSRAINIDLCEIELTHQADESDEQGTVAHGFIVWKGKRYAYRQVRWTPAQCEQANITANKLGGSWDFDVLANSFDVGDLLEWGFEPHELQIDTKPEAGADTEPQTDRAEELRQQWGVESGQLWRLGEHRLICGDCTDAATVARVMDGERADLCMTDPPYGADIQYNGHEDTQQALTELVAGFFPLAERCSSLIALTPGINNVWMYKRPDWMLCWFYAAGTGRTPWGFSAWQPVLVWGKDPKLANGEGAHPDGYNWPMTSADAAERKAIDHVCPKPVSSWAKWIERLSNNKTRVVYDPFSGSGTTIIACENLGRKCRAVEISPAYVAVALQRWADHTGRAPELVQ